MQYHLNHICDFYRQPGSLAADYLPALKEFENARQLLEDFDQDNERLKVFDYSQYLKQQVAAMKRLVETRARYDTLRVLL
jgi:hypothetical protein